MSRIKYNSGGFTAIELVVMIVVLAITFTAFASSFNTISLLNRKSQDMSTASTLAYSKLQEYQNKPFAEIGGNTSSNELSKVEDFSASFPASFKTPHTATVNVSNLSSSLKQIVVNVTYGNGDNPKKVQYYAFIPRSGK